MFSLCSSRKQPAFSVHFTVCWRSVEPAMAQTWENPAPQIFFAASKRRAVTDPIWIHAAVVECGVDRGEETVSVCRDFAQLYVRMEHHILQANRETFGSPLPVLRVAVSAYRMQRVLVLHGEAALHWTLQALRWLWKWRGAPVSRSIAEPWPTCGTYPFRNSWRPASQVYAGVLLSSYRFPNRPHVEEVRWVRSHRALNQATSTEERQEIRRIDEVDALATAALQFHVDRRRLW